MGGGCLLVLRLLLGTESCSTAWPLTLATSAVTRSVWRTCTEQEKAWPDRSSQTACVTAPPEPLLFSQKHQYFLAFKRYLTLSWNFRLFDVILKSWNLGWKWKQIWKPPINFGWANIKHREAFHAISTTTKPVTMGCMDVYLVWKVKAATILLYCYLVLHRACLAFTDSSVFVMLTHQAYETCYATWASALGTQDFGGRGGRLLSKDYCYHLCCGWGFGAKQHWFTEENMAALLGFSTSLGHQSLYLWYLLP